MDVVALGELLIDFTPAGVSAAGNELYERNPGGAPANVLAAVSRLGGSAAFIGKVGDDRFGRYLGGTLEKLKVDTRGLRFSPVTPTTLAFVHLNADGDRSFSFYRNPGADTTLQADEVDTGLIDGCRIFHFGSLSLTDEPSRSATIWAAEYARRAGKLISYDPNWRPPLWKSEAAARKEMLTGLRYADILKVSREELELLTGDPDMERAAKSLLRGGIALVLVTLGPAGCYYRRADGGRRIATYDTGVVDTTGSGDAFLGCLLHGLSRFSGRPEDLPKEQLEDIIDQANAAGALCAAKKGAIPALPTAEELAYCRANTPRLNKE